MLKPGWVVFEKGPLSYGAMVPDLPGCFAVGKTLEETRTRIAEAIAAHIKLLQQDGDPVPQPSVLELGEITV